MDDGFLLRDAPGAQAFLRVFSAKTRRHGQALAAQGAVTELAADIPGEAFSAVVTDRGVYNVRLHSTDESEDELGWAGECSCGAESGCPHMVAVMQEVLAQYSEAVVRQLSS